MTRGGESLGHLSGKTMSWLIISCRLFNCLFAHLCISHVHALFPFFDISPLHWLLERVERGLGNLCLLPNDPSHALALIARGILTRLARKIEAKEAIEWCTS